MRHTTRHGRHRLARIVSTVLTAGCLALAGILLVPTFLGYERYVITSGSMAGAYDRGSIVFGKAVPVAELAVGDVITYTPPEGSGPDGMVTHRIFSIDRDRFGRPVFRTKGDANASADPWTFTLDQPEQGRIEFSVPYAGYAFSALGAREVRMLVIGLPALVIGLAVALALFREALPVRAYPPVPSRYPPHRRWGR